MSNKQRPMSNLEQWCTILHDEVGNDFSCILSVVIEGIVLQEDFFQALKAQFEKQPILRVKKTDTNKDLFFSFTANFEDIPVTVKSITSLSEAKKYCLTRCMKRYDFSQYYWRASLLHTMNKQRSVIILDCSHAIVDGISMHWLMGDLLRDIIAIKKGDPLTNKPFPVPELMDQLIDNSKFFEPTVTVDTDNPPFKATATNEKFQSCHIKKVITPNALGNLIKTFKQNNVTLTSALIAAHIPVYQKYINNIKPLNTLLPFNLKPYYKKALPPNFLGANFNAAPCSFNFNSSKDFWDNCHSIKAEMNRAIKEFQLVPYTDRSINDDTIKAWFDCQAEKKCLLPVIVSQFGLLNNAYKGIEPELIIIDIDFIQSQEVPIYQYSIHAFTALDSLYLNFNFSSEIIDKTAMERIANELVISLLEI